MLDKQTNEWKDGDTVFLRCSVWRQYAENVAESLTAGMRVIVTGRLKARQYETREGEKRTVVELDVDEVGPALQQRHRQGHQGLRAAVAASGGGGGGGGSAAGRPATTRGPPAPRGRRRVAGEPAGGGSAAAGDSLDAPTDAAPGSEPPPPPTSTIPASAEAPERSTTMAKPSDPQAEEEG